MILRFNNVSFGYEEIIFFQTEVDFLIRCFNKTTIIGQNDVEKSSIFGLMLGT